MELYLFPIRYDVTQALMQRDLKRSPSEINKVIVYVPTKNTACKVYHFLRAASTNKQSVGMYHADLTQATKSSVYQDFTRSCSVVRCLVATIAFGMVCGVQERVHVHILCAIHVLFLGG